MKGHREPKTSRELAACEVLQRAMHHAYQAGKAQSLANLETWRYRTKLLNAMRGPQPRHRDLADATPEGA